MSEAEWLTCNEPGPMLGSFGANCSERKLRLFAVGCGRHVQQNFYGPASIAALDAADLAAEGAVQLADLEVHQQAVLDGIELYGGEPVYEAAYWACSRDIKRDAERCARYAQTTAARKLIDPDDPDPLETERRIRLMWADEATYQTALLRDIFGNPFRPVVVDPAWRTSTVLALAQGIYEERAFDRMPILADALQDAGCDSEAILTHCRGPGPHVRGCWVVDLLLGKE